MKPTILYSTENYSYLREKILLELDATKKRTQNELDGILSEANNLAGQIGNLFKSGKKAEAEDLKNKSTELKESSKKLEEFLLRSFKSASVEFKKFPDGELYHRLDPNEVDNSDVVLIGGTINDSETLELFDMACAVVEYGANSLTMVVPWYGYCTAERAVKAGEIVKAKTRAKLLSAIPNGAVRNRIILVDLHAEGILHYFEGNLQSIQVYGKPLILKACIDLCGKDFVLGSTDAGRAKWVESLANDMGVECAIIIKRRSSGTKTEVVGINADVKNKNVIIYDDMIRTGVSLMNAARAYKNAGASKIYVVSTHGVLPGLMSREIPDLEKAGYFKTVYDNPIYKLMNSGLFEKIIVTNTHCQANVIEKHINNGISNRIDFAESKLLKNFFEVRDISSLIAAHL